MQYCYTVLYIVFLPFFESFILYLDMLNSDAEVRRAKEEEKGFSPNRA